MPSLVLLRQPVTDALLVMLRATTSPDNRPLRVGDHRAPEVVPPAKVPETPFAVLSLVSGPGATGSYRDPASDGRLVYQLLSVGENRRSAEWMADQLRTAMLGRNANGEFVRPVTLANGAVIDRQLEATGPATEEGDWWNAADLFALEVSTA